MPHGPHESLPRIRGEWIAAAAAIAAGTACYADVIRFDNVDGANAFYWPFGVLDVTVPHDQQAGDFGAPSTSYQAYFGDSYPAFSYGTTYQQGGGMEIFSAGFSDRYAAPLDAGTIVGPGLLGDGSFTDSTVFEFSWDACKIYYVGYPCYCYYYGDCSSGERGIIPEGVETYLGVRFDVGNGTQYGWVKVIRSWVEVHALAWGFETEPGVPIKVGAAPCEADLDGSGAVDVNDLLAVLANWGGDGPGAGLATPFNEVDVADLLTLLENWGECAAPIAGAVPPSGTLAALAHGGGSSD